MEPAGHAEHTNDALPRYRDSNSIVLTQGDGPLTQSTGFAAGLRQTPGRMPGIIPGPAWTALPVLRRSIAQVPMRRVFRVCRRKSLPAVAGRLAPRFVMS